MVRSLNLPAEQLVTLRHTTDSGGVVQTFDAATMARANAANPLQADVRRLADARDAFRAAVDVGAWGGILAAFHHWQAVRADASRRDALIQDALVFSVELDRALAAREAGLRGEAG